MYTECLVLALVGLELSTCGHELVLRRNTGNRQTCGPAAATGRRGTEYGGRLTTVLLGLRALRGFRSIFAHCVFDLWL